MDLDLFELSRADSETNGVLANLSNKAHITLAPFEFAHVRSLAVWTAFLNNANSKKIKIKIK